MDSDDASNPDNEEDQDPSWLLKLSTAVRLQEPFKNSAGVQFDKRLQLESLSEGRWILRRAGFPDPGQTDPHPIAAPGPKYGQFRLLLKQYGEGYELKKEHMDQITLYQA